MLFHSLMAYQTPVEKAAGLTASEAFLARLCSQAFLSLWSYSNVFRAPGRELCDLLVVFGDEVIIFSDKFVPFHDHKDLHTGWRRWFARSVAASARQAWGAASALAKNPDRVFLDEACRKPFPFKLSRPLPVHLVVVAHGAAAAVRGYFGDSGSLMLDSTIKGLSAHVEPFRVGDLDPTKPFVHVLDDESLLTVISHRDTITDFLHYLRKRERLFRNLSTTLRQRLREFNEPRPCLGSPV